MIELKGRNTDAKIFTDEVDEDSLSLIYGILNNPSITEPVRIMPDTHLGKGIVIGFTMPLGEVVAPEWVGVDIGCGMASAAYDIPSHMVNEDFLNRLDEQIKNTVPMGFDIHDRSVAGNIMAIFARSNEIARKFTDAYNKKFGTNYEAPVYTNKWFRDKIRQVGTPLNNFRNSLGTLGGGNHFIELGSNEQGQFWVTVHSGSRNFGYRVARHWTNVAKNSTGHVDIDEYNRRLEDIRANTYPKTDIPKRVDELQKEFKLGKYNESSLLRGEDLINYCYDMIFAQQYALANRHAMIDIISEALGEISPFMSIDSIHNFIDFKDMIIRKGAISSYENELNVIPLNMRDGILICEGKSNEDWNFSAPHGAGRILSRTQAKATIDIADFEESMKGIVSSSVSESTLDESPFAYKDSDFIEQAIEPTARITDKIKPLLNIKG